MALDPAIVRDWHEHERNVAAQVGISVDLAVQIHILSLLASIHEALRRPAIDPAMSLEIAELQRDLLLREKREHESSDWVTT